MTSLVALGIDAADPVALERFYADLLGPEPGVALRFHPSPVAKAAPNQTHLDLASESSEQQASTVARALALGARHLDVGQRPAEGHVVLADPEGNELCVVGGGNGFLAGCPLLGCVTASGSRALGVFWSRALGWPLVWDRDEETAIQAPGGGTKLSWGGEAAGSYVRGSRLRLVVDGDVDELLALGATLVGEGPGGATVLHDPDGNDLWVE